MQITKAGHAIFFLFVFLFISCSEQKSSQSDVAIQNPSILPEVQLVKGLVNAFNNHDPAAMGKFLAEDIVWYGMYADTFAVEAEGREALVHSMTGYFKSLPSARSKIESITPAGSYIAVRERAYWQGKSGEKSQASLAVYEIKASEVNRVWYFPATD
ncbi:MAG: nuclear transport factor 2 family protein [Calditrichia bacterium]